MDIFRTSQQQQCNKYRYNVINIDIYVSIGNKYRYVNIGT